MNQILQSLYSRRELAAFNYIMAENVGAPGKSFLALTPDDGLMAMFILPTDWLLQFRDFIDVNHLRYDEFFFSVRTNVKFSIFAGEHEENITSDCVVINFTTNDGSRRDYYVALCCKFFEHISEIDQFDELLEEINLLVKLLRLKEKGGMKAITGLWAELYCVMLFKDTELGLNSWTKSKESTLDLISSDFNIEVKSTRKKQRAHSFSKNQIQLFTSKPTFVMSLLLLESDSGHNVYDLADQIDKKLGARSIKMHEKIGQVIGQDAVEAAATRFDLTYAGDNLKIFDMMKLPFPQIHDPRILDFECQVLIENEKNEPREKFSYLLQPKPLISE